MPSYLSDTGSGTPDESLLNSSMHRRPISTELLLHSTRGEAPVKFGSLDDALMPVRVRLKLGKMPFNVVLRDAGFHRRLTWDIAGALMVSQTRVTVAGIEPMDAHDADGNGGIVAHIDLEPSKGAVGRRPALELARDLARQAMFSESALMTSATTSATVDVEVITDREEHSRAELARLRSLVIALSANSASPQHPEPRDQSLHHMGVGMESTRAAMPSRTPAGAYTPSNDPSDDEPPLWLGGLELLPVPLGDQSGQSLSNTRKACEVNGTGMASKGGISSKYAGPSEPSSRVKKFSNKCSDRDLPESDDVRAVQNSTSPASLIRNAITCLGMSMRHRFEKIARQGSADVSGAGDDDGSVSEWAVSTGRRGDFQQKQRLAENIIKLTQEQYRRVVGMVVAMVLTIMITVYTHRMWMLDDEDQPVVVACKIVCSVISLYMVFTTRMYQLTKNFIEIRRGRRGLLSLSLMLRRMGHLFEIVILCIFPWPYIEGHAIVYSSERSLYHVETLLTMAVLCRVYIIMRFFRAEMRRVHKGARIYSIGADSLNVNTYFFWIKFALDQDSLQLILRFSIFFVLWSAYMVYLSESPYHVKGEMNPGWVPSARSVAAMEVSNAFGDYGNCVWFVIVTMTTTGYGDYTPISPIGRAIAFIIMLVGIALAAIITALLNDRLSLQPDESRFVNTMIHAGLHSKRINLAARVVTHFIRFVIRFKNRPEKKLIELKRLSRYTFEAMQERMKIIRADKLKPSIKALLEDVHIAVIDRFDDRIGKLVDKVEKMQTLWDSRLSRIEERMEGRLRG